LAAAVSDRLPAVDGAGAAEQNRPGHHQVVGDALSTVNVAPTY
jgi:hypothetical protein